MMIDAYVRTLTTRALASDLDSSPSNNQPLEMVLKGLAVELWSDTLGERFWIVSDEVDVARLGEPRGSVYTASEVRHVVSVNDPEIVAEIHRWKRMMNASISQYETNRDSLSPDVAVDGGFGPRPKSEL
jgi:hypothetical protein